MQNTAKSKESILKLGKVFKGMIKVEKVFKKLIMLT